MNPSLTAIIGAIVGAFVAYMAAAFFLCIVFNLGNLCGLPAVFIAQPIGAIVGAIVGWRLGQPPAPPPQP